MRIARFATVLVAMVAVQGTSASGEDFPSPDSSVVCHIGTDAACVQDPNEIGFFWDAGRGDSVEESFPAPAGIPYVTNVVFDFVIPRSSLLETAEWGVRLNGAIIGEFHVDPNQLGAVHLEFPLAPSSAPSYDVRFEMTNVVSGGAGSHSLGTGGALAGTVEFLGPDDLQCWQVKDRKAPKFTKIADLPVSDPFSNGTVDVKKPLLVCAPAGVDGAPIQDPERSMCCYAIKGDKLKPPASIEIQDAFGTLELDVKKPKQLCVPCSQAPL